MKKKVVISKKQNRRLEIPHLLAGVLCSRIFDDVTGSINDENIANILKEKWKGRLDAMNNIAKPIVNIVDKLIHIDSYKSTFPILSEAIPPSSSSSSGSLSGIVQHVNGSLWNNSRGKPLSNMSMPEYPCEIEFKKSKKSRNIEIVYSDSLENTIIDNNNSNNNNIITTENVPASVSTIVPPIKPDIDIDSHTSTDNMNISDNLDITGIPAGALDLDNSDQNQELNEDLIADFDEYFGNPDESHGTYITGKCTKVCIYVYST